MNFFFHQELRTNEDKLIKDNPHFGNEIPQQN